jgi:hypothetical protein
MRERLLKVEISRLHSLYVPNDRSVQQPPAQLHVRPLRFAKWRDRSLTVEPVLAGVAGIGAATTRERSEPADRGGIEDQELAAPVVTQPITRFRPAGTSAAPVRNEPTAVPEEESVQSVSPIEVAPCETTAVAEDGGRLVRNEPTAEGLAGALRGRETNPRAMRRAPGSGDLSVMQTAGSETRAEHGCLWVGRHVEALSESYARLVSDHHPPLPPLRKGGKRCGERSGVIERRPPFGGYGAGSDQG